MSKKDTLDVLFDKLDLITHELIKVTKEMESIESKYSSINLFNRAGRRSLKKIDVKAFKVMQRRDDLEEEGQKIVKEIEEIEGGNYDEQEL